MNIIFVCTGNTCRSPMAEGFMKHIYSSNNLHFNVLSRGLYVDPLSKPSQYSIKALSEYGIDISSHTPRQITLDDIKNSDIIITMTQSHKDALNMAYGGFDNKIISISEYTNGLDIKDPYGCDYETYKACAKDINNACKVIFDTIFGN